MDMMLTDLIYVWSFSDIYQAVFQWKGLFYANLQHVVQMFWAQISSMIRYKNCGEKGVAYTCWWLL